jgi:hypothetical protein
LDFGIGTGTVGFFRRGKTCASDHQQPRLDGQWPSRRLAFVFKAVFRDLQHVECFVFAVQNKAGKGITYESFSAENVVEPNILLWTKVYLKNLLVLKFRKESKTFVRSLTIRFGRSNLNTSKSRTMVPKMNARWVDLCASPCKTPVRKPARMASRASLFSGDDDEDNESVALSEETSSAVDDDYLSVTDDDYLSVTDDDEAKNHHHRHHWQDYRAANAAACISNRWDDLFPSKLNDENAAQTPSAPRRRRSLVASGDVQKPQWVWAMTA